MKNKKNLNLELFENKVIKNLNSYFNFKAIKLNQPSLYLTKICYFSYKILNERNSSI